MNEHEIAAILNALQYECGEDGEPILEQLESASSFEDAGILTRNRGVVWRMADGSEFQITVVRSAAPNRKDAQ